MNSNNADRINEYRAFLSFSDFVEDDDRLYFANTNYNALVTVDKKTWTVESLQPFEGAGRTAQNLHLRCVKAQNKICFLPAEASYVHIYDMEHGTQRTCHFQEEVDVPQGPWEYFVCDSQVYLLPGYAFRGLWRWNVEADAIEREDWWKIPIGVTTLQHGAMSGEAFYTLETDTNRLCITNVSTKTIESFSLPDEKISHIAYDCVGQNFWYVVSGSPEIVCWNQAKGVVKKYNISVDEFFGYIKICYAFGNLFLVSAFGDELYLLDRDKSMLRSIHSIQCARGSFFEVELMPSFKIIDGQLICMLRNAGDVISINLDTLDAIQCALIFHVNSKVKEWQYTIVLDRNALLFEEKGEADLERLLQYCSKTEEQY